MAALDVYQQQLFYHANQKQFVTTFHWEEIQEDTSEIPAAAINIAFRDDLLPLFDNLFSNEVVFGCLKTTIIKGADRASNVLYLEDTLGEVSVEAAPGASALRLVLRGENHGRRQTGALVMSGWHEDAYVDGNWADTYRDYILGTVFPALDAALVGTGTSTGQWQFGYMSRADVNPVDPPIDWPGVFIRPDGYTVAPQPQTLRSRQGTYTASRAT